MKAYHVCVKHEYYGEVVHADTPAQAKRKAHAYLDCYGSDWIVMRATRMPELDDKPLTYDNMEAAGIDFWFEGEKTIRSQYHNICDCPICKDKQEG